MHSLSFSLYLFLVLVILLTSQPAWAFSTLDHTSITDKALDVFGFGLAAVRKILHNNIVTDTSRALFFTPELHFDNELLAQSNQQLMKLKNEVKEKLKVCNRPEARAKLGRALHILQDFYAHTNWVETHSSINFDLGTEKFKPELALAPCPLAFDSLEFDGLNPNFLTSGYFLNDECNSKSLEPGGPLHGKCLHGANYQADMAHCGGIAKDSVLPGDEDIQEKAITMAQAASIIFIQQISNELKVFGPPDLFDALRLQPGQAQCKKRIPTRRELNRGS